MEIILGAVLGAAVTASAYAGLRRFSALQQAHRDGASSDEVIPVDIPTGGTRLLARSSILYLRARGDYVRIVAEDGRYLLRGTISDLERRWAPFGFVRTHRGYVANLRRAVEVRPGHNGTAILVFPDGDEIPIARRKLTELRRELTA
jgi:two-component system, LytTR family, response regulator LytT